MSDSSGQASGSGIPIIVETIGSYLVENEQPSVAGKKTRSFYKVMKTKQDFLEEIILKHAMHHSPPLVSADATEEEKQADRQRRLNAKTTRWRMVFSRWPRDPKGKYITPENSQPGKMAPNKEQLWGATLFDFFGVRRIPDLASLLTYSSGSKLAAWMKANNEDYAKSALEFAENEPDPHLVLPYDIAKLVRAEDKLVAEKSWVRDDRGGGRGRFGKGKGKEREGWQVPQPWPPTSPFDTLAYPKPWPNVPFAKNVIGARNPKLQKYIIHSHLPKILKVHDPWNLLLAARIPEYEREAWEKEIKKKWSDKTDVVHTYRLKTSSKNTTRRTEDDKIAEEEEAKRKAVYDKFIVDPHTRNELPSGTIFDQDPGALNQPGPTKPPVFVLFPFQPLIPPAREAHLYLSPSGSIGVGNHSFVYKAEFELPRSTILDDELCDECIKNEVYRILKEEDGPDGGRRDPKWDQEVGRYVVKTDGKPGMTMSLDTEDGSGEEEYLFEPDTLHLTLEYEGPFRVIHSKIGFQCLERGPYCEHIAKSKGGIHPLTAKVLVAAKLSIQDDNHLGREAETYQAFPRHFFEHWSGFNITKPLKEPTPVGPLVPQFYGYYVPEKDAEQLDSDESQSGTPDRRDYLSPILLLEECGSQIKPKNLTLDDQNEAASLVFRFHDACWLHGSIAKRNILIQPGPLSDSPLMRLANSHARGGHGVDWSFRLIDFGRSFPLFDYSQHEMNSMVVAEEISVQNWVILKGDFD